MRCEAPLDELSWIIQDKYFPEYTIEYTLDDDGNAYQYYLFNQTDITPHWRKIRLFYHQTLLEEMEGVSLDGGRYFTPTPFTDGISLSGYHNWDIIFKYFIVDSLEYIVHQFYYEPDGDEETHAHNCFEECLLIFESEDEKLSFEEYVEKNLYRTEMQMDNIHLPYFPDIDGYIMDEFKKEYRNVQILRTILDEFRKMRT